jgi:chitodextrinase
VLHTTSPYAIYWDGTGAGIPSSSKGVINRYLTDLAADSGEADSVYGVGRQYYDSQGFADAGQTFSAASQALTDHDPYPTSGCPVFSPYTSCITDAQLTTELSSFIAANGLPTDGPATESELPAQAPVYFVMLPQNVDTCKDSTGSQCSDGSAYCAYHSFYFDSGNNVVLYSNVPFSVFSVGPKGCQADGNTTFQAPNGDQADNIVDNLSHELNEVITDPVLNAWVNAPGGNELADQCAQYGASPDPVNGASPNAYAPVLGGVESAGTLYDQLINGDRYYTQSLWSNGQADCELQPTAAALTASFTMPGLTEMGHAVSIDPTGTLSAAGVASTTWDWGDGTTSFVVGSPAVTSHVFASAGVHTVKLTVVDANGNMATATRQVSVGTAPTVAIGSLPGSVVEGVGLSFSASPSTDTNLGANPSFSWNFGDGTSATGVTALHSYHAPGIYTVTLTLTDAYGFTGLKTATLDVVAARILKLSHTGHGSSTRLLVSVNAPGKLLYGGRTTDLAAAGTAKLKIALTAKQKRALAKHPKHKFWVTARVVYAPLVGSRVAEDISVKL